MMWRMRNLLLTLVATWTTCGLLAAVAWSQKTDVAKTPLRIDDLYLFDQTTAVTLSPDRASAFYIRQWIDRETRIERNSLWHVASAAAPPTAVEADQPDATGPVFSPDGQWLAFRSTRPRPAGWQATPPVPLESEAATDIWLLRIADKKIFPLAGPQKPYGRVFSDPFYSRVVFSPNGKRLAFVADDGVDPRSREEIDADVYVVRPDQGEGYTSYRPAQIWVADLAAQPTAHAAEKIQRLTNDDVWYGDPQWSPDGAKLVVHANRTNDRESVRFSINKNFDLWEIDIATQQLRALTSGAGADISPRFSPDGKTLACLSSPRKGPHADVYNLTLINLSGGSPTAQVVFDHHADSPTNTAPPIPAFPLPDTCWDDAEHLVYSSNVGVDSQRVRINVRTGVAQVIDKTLSAEQSRFVAEQQARGKLARGENAVLRERLLGTTGVVQWKSDDGLAIDGVLTTPHESVAKAPFKLILYPHGGPHSRSATGFNFTVEAFAAHGYAVFQPNFRGSQGYGKKFLDADRHDLGGGDMRDILSGIEQLIRDGVVDRQRQFVYGISYGGFMTTWLVGHTHQFRAAVAQNAVTDLNAMWGLSDIQSWTEWEFGGPPWETPDAMRKHSPITYADQVKTPTLILHAREDRRCPIAMGTMFYQSLLRRQVPTQMVVYPHEGHGIRQPKHRADVLRRTLAWFAEHDQK